jgi:xanthine dehydrogenase accessory factor
MLDPIAAAACRLLEEKKPFVIATIVSQEGSAPRTAGTKMIVSQAGSVGTIGGGRLEADAQQRAAEILAGTPEPALLPFDLTSAQTADMDMICGGKGAVLLDPVAVTEENRDLFQKWKSLLEARASGWLVSIATGIGSQEQQIGEIAHCVLESDSQTCTGPMPAHETWEAIAAAARQTVTMSTLTQGDVLALIEPAARPVTAFFFGAGHVAQPTAQIAAMTGFRTVVVDDREAYANRERFPQVDAVRVIENFDTAIEELLRSDLEIDDMSYIVIFTRGHRHDRSVLAQALRTRAAYIGMIGSRRKRDLIYAALKKEGFTKTDIERVYSPIGLAIQAETPEEIAVSIVAELIQERARSQR